MTTTETESWRQLIGRILELRQDDRGFRANVSRGLLTTTEYYAYPYVLPFAAHPGQNQPLLRAAALTAQHIKTAQYSPPASSNSNSEDPTAQRKWAGPMTLGRSFALASRQLSPDGVFSDPSKPDAIAQRLRTLDQQSLDDAAVTIDRILTIGEKLASPIPIDYYRLTRLLLRWGNGISPESLDVRRSIQREYYSGAAFIDTVLTSQANSAVAPTTQDTK